MYNSQFFFFFLKRSKIKAAEDEIAWLSVPSMCQAPKTLDPTLPIVQLEGVIH